MGSSQSSGQQDSLVISRIVLWLGGLCSSVQGYIIIYILLFLKHYFSCFPSCCISEVRHPGGGRGGSNEWGSEAEDRHRSSAGPQTTDPPAGHGHLRLGQPE